MKVTGTLPTETVASLEDAGIKYIPWVAFPAPASRHVMIRFADVLNFFRRDGSANEEES